VQFFRKLFAVWDKFCSPNQGCKLKLKKSLMIKIKYENKKVKKRNVMRDLPNI
jgi:hypothetical protein